VEATVFQYADWQSSAMSTTEKYPWFHPNTTDGQVYEIPQDQNTNYGTVIVDRTQRIVYIQTSHS